jgi:hypothetical protein
MKPKVYIETTIISYLASKPSRDLITAAHHLCGVGLRRAYRVYA